MTLKEFLERHNVETRSIGEHHHATLGRIQVDCPYCSPESGKFRLGVSSVRANCWTCGPHRILETLVLLTKQNWKVCKQFVKEQEYTPDKYPVVQRGRLKLPEGITELQHAHLQYLSKHNLNAEELHDIWGVRALGLTPSLQWRLFIPVIFDNRIVSWTTRSISDKVKAKYISAKPSQEIYGIKTLLYGEDHTAHRVVVVEGPKDVWKIGRGAVATFGVEYTNTQVYRIARYPVRYICFDNEPPAQQMARKLCRELMGFPGETHNVCIDSKDPGSAKPYEIKELRNLIYG